jgi:hypothetical protein
MGEMGQIGRSEGVNGVGSYLRSSVTLRNSRFDHELWGRTLGHTFSRVGQR